MSSHSNYDAHLGHQTLAWDADGRTEKPIVNSTSPKYIIRTFLGHIKLKLALPNKCLPNMQVAPQMRYFLARSLPFN